MSFLKALDAERSFYTAEDSLIVSRVAIATSYIALAKALGGGWDGSIDSSLLVIIEIKTRPQFLTDKSETPIAAAIDK